MSIAGSQDAFADSTGQLSPTIASTESEINDFHDRTDAFASDNKRA